MPSGLLNGVIMYARMHRQGYLWEGVLYGFIWETEGVWILFKKSRRYTKYTIIYSPL